MVNTETNVDISSNIFDSLSKLCLDNNWYMLKHDNEIIYTNNKKELIFTDTPYKVKVSIPLKNSDMNYSTTFSNYYEAIQYAIQSLNYYFQDV
jgi:ribosome-associated translation inhibitor RaiA|tara:strand:+ start:456 stop:734 length:279 start_codon:yes stop_codon:yes gene_type:complete